MTETTLVTQGGLQIVRSEEAVPYENAIEDLIDHFDGHRGALFSSNYEYPGRYTRWDTAVIDPPLVITSAGRDMRIEALSERGELLLPVIEQIVGVCEAIESLKWQDGRLAIRIAEPSRSYSEEERSRMPSVFSVLRAITDFFHLENENALGLYGAFGYDLAFQFDPIDLKLQRPDGQRDMVLFLPDQLILVDHYAVEATRYSYDYRIEGQSTAELAGNIPEERFLADGNDPPHGDHEPGEYAELVRLAKKSFAKGDLFEVVPGQVFYEKCDQSPAKIFRRLRSINPSPYSFFINLGEAEYLVGASPEMFVRVTGRRVETCPISGTIKRGEDAIEDSEQILKLLNSKKDESELTMCSDVDRNDKSRVCEPGSVRLIGRRQIEMYSRLIHTVDHIEGRLREGMDAYDAFLSHAWAVTVTGAPKLWAMRFIEEHEKSPRVWYGGAVGIIGFNGDMNTGLTLRTVRIKNGIAEVRAGATLLFDSDPEEEERETELKASAMRAAVHRPAQANFRDGDGHDPLPGLGKRLLLIDHEDSFVHTLANYFRQAGAEVVTIRTPVSVSVLEETRPDLVVLSPGPGSPSDFDTLKTLEELRKRELPVFGVCLGLQAIAESFGADLGQLDLPMHGKPSRISITMPGRLFEGLPEEITVGRYHSLFARAETLPDELKATAVTSDGVVMAIEHRDKPIAAVQFHPESIMSLGRDAGMRIIRNVVANLATRSNRNEA